eukprot:s5555_g4.t1
MHLTATLLLAWLPTHPAVAPLLLPSWLRCDHPRQSQVGDIPSIIYSILSRALPGALETAPVHQLGDDELGCALMDLGELTEAQETLFRLLQQQAHLSLVLSDLGRLAGTSRDFILDPWLLEHCRKRPDPKACGETFAEAAAAQSGRMVSVARALHLGRSSYSAQF